MIFVDTSYWVGLHLRRDRHHDAARRLLADVGDRALVMTNHVLGETWTVLRRRDSHRVATDFLDLVDATPRVELVQIERDVEDRAIEWLRRHDERRYSFVDATSFELMRRRTIREALAFDGDFSAAGFVELRPA